MAAEINTGMEKPDMKRLLTKSKQEPVNCAIGQGTDATSALLLLDRIKSPQMLEKEVLKLPGAKATRFGAAHVDLDLDPKEVRFTINKAAPGIARRLVKTLKGTGFTKAVIVSAEDGSVLESFGEEEAAPAPAEEPAPAAAAAVAPAAPPPPPAAQLDAAALTRALTEQVRRIPGALAVAPAMKEQLTRLATEAQANLKAGTLPTAAADIEALRHALDAASNGAAPAGAAADAAKVTYAKARLAWLAARKGLEADIAKLRRELVAAYADDSTFVRTLDGRYQERVGPLLATLDESLADKLDEAMNATDPAQRAKLVEQARATIARYEGFVASEPMLVGLEENPLVPLTTKRTLEATLATLAKAVH